MLDPMPEVTIGLVLDCRDPESLAAFWTKALGLVHLGSVENYALLASEDGRLPKLLLQKVDEAKTGKNRMHLDIETSDVDSEVHRLEGIGAHRIETTTRSEHGTHWVIMADPEGNEFCVCDGGSGS
jgi:predicted enzyme related to lactoylglutathione lyase